MKVCRWMGGSSPRMTRLGQRSLVSGEAQARAPQPPQRATPRDGDGKPGGEGPPYADRLREVVNAEKSQAQPHKRGLRMREHRGRRLATDAGWMTATKLPITIGNTANTPEANEPIQWLAVVTTATTTATAAARSGRS